VTDARDPAEGALGEECLLGLLAGDAGSAPALLSRVDAALSAHIGDAAQFDDIAMLAIRRAS
jgi:phosphoserine phosphatase RsbU/P